MSVNVGRIWFWCTSVNFSFLYQASYKVYLRFKLGRSWHVWYFFSVHLNGFPTLSLKGTTTPTIHVLTISTLYPSPVSFIRWYRPNLNSRRGIRITKAGTRNTPELSSFKAVRGQTYKYSRTVFLFLSVKIHTYEGVSKSFRTGRLERELQMVQLSITEWSCIAILWISLVSFAAIELCVASQRVFIVVVVVVVVYFVMTQSGNFWLHHRLFTRLVGFLSVLFPLGFPTKFFMNFSSLPCMLHSPSMSSSLTGIILCVSDCTKPHTSVATWYAHCTKLIFNQHHDNAYETFQHLLRHLHVFGASPNCL
jgi:hypothetical protein